MSRLVIYGAGGFGRELIHHVKHAMLVRPDFEPPVFASDDSLQIGSIVSGLPVIASTQLRSDDHCIIAIADCVARRAVAERCPKVTSLIAATATVHDGVQIGEGAILCDGTSIAADEKTVIGSHFHMNFGSYVGHDCRIGDFVTFGPRVGCNGNVHIGDGVYIGAGALLINGTPRKPLKIGDGAFVGIGAVVINNVPAGAAVFGNPARVFRSAPAQFA